MPYSSSKHLVSVADVAHTQATEATATLLGTALADLDPLAAVTFTLPIPEGSRLAEFWILYQPALLGAILIFITDADGNVLLLPGAPADPNNGTPGNSMVLNYTGLVDPAHEKFRFSLPVPNTPSLKLCILELPGSGLAGKATVRGAAI